MREHIGTAQAIVFAAGAGPGSGPERKRTVDWGGALKLIDAARELGVARYVIVSSMGMADVEHAPEAMRPYMQAKKEADDALMASGLDWTVVRPGRLTDAPGTGTVDVRVGSAGAARSPVTTRRSRCSRPCASRPRSTSASTCWRARRPSRRP